MRSLYIDIQTIMIYFQFYCFAMFLTVQNRLRVLFKNLNDLICKLLRIFIFLFWAKFGHFIELIAKI